jgi:hypothetical protein
MKKVTPPSLENRRRDARRRASAIGAILCPQNAKSPRSRVSGCRQKGRRSRRTLDLGPRRSSTTRVQGALGGGPARAILGWLIGDVLCSAIMVLGNDAQNSERAISTICVGARGRTLPVAAVVFGADVCAAGHSTSPNSTSPTLVVEQKTPPATADVPTIVCPLRVGPRYRS